MTRRTGFSGKKFTDWQNSLEGILYDLMVIPPPSVGTRGMPDPELLIAKTLLKLPPRIRKRVLEKVTFVAMGGQYGTVERYVNSAFLSRDKYTDMIFLDFSAMRAKHRSVAYQMTAIAHEIGHYVSGNLGLVDARKSRQAEMKADDLSEKWGFGRAYRSYSQFQFSKCKHAKKA